MSVFFYGFILDSLDRRVAKIREQNGICAEKYYFVFLDTFWERFFTVITLLDYIFFSYWKWINH